MKTAFEQIPEPLQRQILYRLGRGAAALLLTIALLYYTMELYSVLFCAFVIVFYAVSSFMLFRRAVIGNYVVINGICTAVTLTLLKKRAKLISLRTEDGQVVKVVIKNRLKKVKPGMNVTMYIASEVPVHENEGAHLIYSYLALEAKAVDGGG